MPKFLEDKLKKEYGADSDIPYKVMNSIGAMHGSKETAKGRAMERKHQIHIHGASMHDLITMDPGAGDHVCPLPPRTPDYDDPGPRVQQSDVTSPRIPNAYGTMACPFDSEDFSGAVTSTKTGGILSGHDEVSGPVHPASLYDANGKRRS